MFIWKQRIPLSACHTRTCYMSVVNQDQNRHNIYLRYTGFLYVVNWIYQYWLCPLHKTLDVFSFNLGRKVISKKKLNQMHTDSLPQNLLKCRINSGVIILHLWVIKFETSATYKKNKDRHPKERLDVRCKYRTGNILYIGPVYSHLYIYSITFDVICKSIANYIFRIEILAETIQGETQNKHLNAKFFICQNWD